MRQTIRKTIIAVSLLLFPITMNFFSPYVCIDGAMNGIISGSLLLFFILFLTSVFFGRTWCGWICPNAGLSEIGQGINNKNVNRKKSRVIRYTIFTIWAGVLITMFFLAGEIKGINPLYLTETGISVDAPQKYIIYYFVLGLLFLVTILAGKRGACHSLCWMAPFMEAGYFLGKILKLPQLRIGTEPSACVDCKACDKKCPMSISVSSSVKEGSVTISDCILCGECVDACRKNCLKYTVKHK